MIRIARTGSALLAATALFACGAHERPGVPPRHVLLVTVEAFRADHCSALGYARDTTHTVRIGPDDPSVPPALDVDGLARSGVLFARAFAPSPEPLASLEALFAAGDAAESAPNLAELFASSGWRAAAFWCEASAPPPARLQRGFERFEAVSADALGGAREWIADVDRAGGRAFLWLHLGIPSPPFDARPFEDAFFEPSRGDAPSELDRYDGELARTNALLRAWLEAYRDLPGAPLDRTLVVLAGTNGLALGDSGAPGEGPLSDATLRVPLVLRHPQSLTGSRIFGEVVELADVPPTLRDWFGFESRACARARSLLSLVDASAEHPFEARPALAASKGWTSARGARWRVVRAPDGEARCYEAEEPPARRGAEDRDACAALRAELEARLGRGAKSP